MKLLYDNYEDARNKLLSTFCMYDGKAVYIKALYNPDRDVIADNPNNTFIIIGNYVYNGRQFKCLLDDPKFNFSTFNLGYAVRQDGHGGAWFYRRAIRQYRQGLKSDQVAVSYSSRRLADITFADTKAVATMLENKYPTFETVEEFLRSKTHSIGAFHKNFAATFDEIHDDLVIEYKGKPVGHSISRKDFRLTDDAKHLTEHLMEAVGR